MPEINVKYTYLKQISHTTHSDNIFELVKYKKVDKPETGIEKPEIHSCNTLLTINRAQVVEH